MGLVYNCIKPYTNNKFIEQEDLLQCATLGLFIALKNFNKETNYQFSTFATKVINNEIYKFFKTTNQIKLPVEIIKLKQSIQKLKKISEKELTNLEIAEYLNCDIKLVDYISAISSIDSLEKLNYQNENFSLKNKLQTENNDYEMVENKMWYNKILTECELTDEERLIIKDWCDVKHDGFSKELVSKFKSKFQVERIFNKALVRIRLYLKNQN